ncbi:ead/Ea22-like family protein [Salmonella enterica]|nr:ead/Ea22-like family protein [Salmonella enterica]
MSNIDKQALREVAERATPGNWRRTSSLFNGITVTPFSLCGEEVTLVHTVEKRDAEFIAAANPATMLALLDELNTAQHTASVDHETACSLVEENEELKRKLEAENQRNTALTAKIEPMDRRIAELERSETQLINERDSAESALNDAYKAVMGQAPEWSNWFSFENAIEEIELACELWRNQTDDVIQFRQRIAELEAKLETADRLQDSAFRDGLKAGFSYGQTDDQSGYEQCLKSYSSRGKDNG